VVGKGKNEEGILILLFICVDGGGRTGLEIRSNILDGKRGKVKVVGCDDVICCDVLCWAMTFRKTK
jgi:hypothetical protein